MARLLLMLALVAALLAACSDDATTTTDAADTTVAPSDVSDEGSVTTSSSSEADSSESDPATDDDAEAGSTDTTEAPGGSEGPSDGGGGDAGVEAECLVGRWRIDERALGNSLTGLFRLAGLEVVTEVSGAAVMEFAGDDSYAGTFEDLVVVARDPDDLIPPFTVTFDGTARGTWSAGEDALLLSETSSSVDVVVEIDGVPTDPLIDVGAADPFGASVLSYTCMGDELTLDVPNGPSYEANRVG